MVGMYQSAKLSESHQDLFPFRLWRVIFILDA
jgi:hypothetical protein